LRNVRLIARLDIKGPNLIKGIHLEGLRVIGSPAEHALRYYQQGVDELLYMDCVASLYGRNHLGEIVRKAAENIFVPMTVGGGIRTVDDALQILRAGADKVAIRISPTSTYNNIVHQNPQEQFTLLIKELNHMPLSYIHLMKVPFPADKFPQYPVDAIETFGKLSVHPIIANCGYNRETGEAELQKGIAKLIAYGTLFLANPDLPKRFELNAELNQPDRATMYGGQDKGYIDYPFLA
jgi:2,4-dienoyl-CoA reductase-like NADH-dependent reductase (Old Yellow Enzyme family)